MGFDEKSYIRSLKTLVGDTSATDWKPENLFGLFQFFAPSGSGVEAVFEPLPGDNDELTRRVARVFDAAGESVARGQAYFQPPSHRYSGEQAAHVASEYMSRLRRLAVTIEDDELSEVVQAWSQVQFGSIPDSCWAADENLIVTEVVGDWFADRSHRPGSSPALSVLWEAYYSIAADNELAYALLWPALGGKEADAFEPYLRLWCGGCRCVFTSTGIRVQLAPVEH